MINLEQAEKWCRDNCANVSWLSPQGATEHRKTVWITTSDKTINVTADTFLRAVDKAVIIQGLTDNG